VSYVTAVLRAKKFPISLLCNLLRCISSVAIFWGILVSCLCNGKHLHVCALMLAFHGCCNANDATLQVFYVNVMLVKIISC